jgi:hypothetical protein
MLTDKRRFYVTIYDITGEKVAELDWQLARRNRIGSGLGLTQFRLWRYISPRFEAKAARV